MTIDAIIAWITLAQQLEARGEQVWNDIKAVIASHGIETDNAALDAAFADAERRKRARERDAGGVDPARFVGSTGE